MAAVISRKGEYIEVEVQAKKSQKNRLVIEKIIFSLL